MSDATRTTAVAPAEANLLARLWQRTSRIDPRYLIAGLITLVLLVAQLRYHMFGGYTRLVIALGVCMATEAALSWFDRGRVVNLQSAYISGISLTLLTKPQGNALWPFVIGGFLAISSKYVLRYREQHLWNPTNFAISALLLAAPSKVAVLSHQFGNDLVTNLVIWVFGLIIAKRVGVLHITLTYVELPRPQRAARSGARAAALPRARARDRPDVSAVRVLHDHGPAHGREGPAATDGRRRAHRPRRDAVPPDVRSRRIDADRLQRRPCPALARDRRSPRQVPRRAPGGRQSW